MQRSEKIKLISSCLLGNILEWFDFAVYGYLAPVIAGQFFPSSNKLAAMLLTYSVFAIGFLVRPIGAIVFGYIGDSYGRKTALVLSSLMMSIPTVFIGFLPNFESIGLAAPLLLILCRIFQGLSLGGEFTGSFVYLVEQGSPGKKGFFSCWADIGCSLGMILGSLSVAALYSFLTPEQMGVFGWRLPFLSGILLALVAIYIRTNLKESQAFIKPLKTQLSPLKQLFSHSPKTLFFATLLFAVNAFGYYTLVVFIPNQTVLLNKLVASETYLINTIVLLVIMVATFLSASACDYYDKVKLYIAGTITVMLFAYPAFYALENATLLTQMILMCCMAVGVGFCFGPRSLFLVEIFPTQFRFSAIAIALNLGNAIFGGTAPLLAIYSVEKTGTLTAPSILIIISAALTLIAIFKLAKFSESEKNILSIA